jgi:indole-3-glycerol phosphate synthase
MGADAALLIAAVLPNADLAYLLKSAAKLRLQILIEVHTVAGAHAAYLTQMRSR